MIGAHPAGIHTHLPSERPPLPDLDGDATVDAGGGLTVDTNRLQDDLTRLLTWADEHRLTLEELRATGATLDQVFHEIDGAQPMGSSHVDEETIR